jgi:thiamine pyrophosphate-dependent acetolactate synthase large subunit-like protein
LWSKAWNEMRAFVEKAGIPFYTTPQGGGVDGFNPERSDLDLLVEFEPIL